MRAFCLTLPEQPERSKRADEHFQERGLAVQFVCAVNGHLTGLKSSHPYEHDHPGTGYVIGPATIGIYLSHYIAWSIAAASPDESTLIFEDDVILCPDFKAKLNKVLLDAPLDWDMLFLGSCCTDGHPKEHKGGDVYSIQWPQCLHAYVINKTAAYTLTRNCRDVYAPVDCFLALNKFFGLKVYTVLPRLAEQLNTNLPP